MSRGILIGVVIIFILSGVFAYLVFNLGDSSKVEVVDLKALSDEEAVAKLSEVEEKIVSYDAVTEIKIQMVLSIFALMSIDSESYMESSLDRENKKYHAEGIAKFNSTVETLDEFDFEGFDFEEKSEFKESEFKIDIKDNRIITDFDGNVTEEILTEDMWVEQDLLLRTSEFLNSSDFVYLSDEKIDGYDCYVLKYNLTVADAYNFMNNTEDSSLADNPDAFLPDFRVWIGKEDFVVYRVHMELDTMENNTGMYMELDYRISNVKFG
jgi:hypothetical protein